MRYAWIVSWLTSAALVTACNGDGDCRGKNCVPCEVTIDAPGTTNVDAGLFVPLVADVNAADWPWQKYTFAAVRVHADGASSVQLAGIGEGLRVFTDDGASLTLPAELSASDLPATLWLGADRVDATPTLTATSETCGEARLTTRPGVTAGLVGRVLAGHPWLEDASAFFPDASINIALDPARYAERAGLAVDVYVVPHRDDASTWAVDNTLVDVRGAPSSVTIGAASLEAAVTPLWTSPTPSDGAMSASYDVVVDTDGDGTLSPGDLVDGLARPGIVALANLSNAGPHATLQDGYNVSFWDTAVAYWPADLDALVAARGRRPIVVISHGNGHEFTWYDWLGEHLASWGYVVIAHRNDTQPGIDTASRTTLSNTEALIANQASVLGGALAGRIDASRIVWVGHSRGGEGVLRAYDRLVNGGNLPVSFGLGDVVLLSSIAPTAFEGPGRSNPHDRTAHLIAGSADTDVTGGVDAEAVQYYRNFERGTGTHLVTMVQGANHNDFNCCGEDPPFGNPGPRIGRQPTQYVARAYLLALIAWQTEGAPGVVELLARHPDGFRPVGVPTPLATMLRERGDRPAVVLDDFQTSPSVNLSASGGAVTAFGSITTAGVREGPLNDANNSLAWSPADPMNGMTWATNNAPTADRGLVFGWTGDGSVDFALTDGLRDLSRHEALTLRVAQTARHPDNDGPLAFGIALTDAAGNRSLVDMSVYGRVTIAAPRGGLGQGTGWVNDFNTLRVPLHAFVADGRALNLGDIDTVSLVFGAEFGAPAGHIGIDDLMFVPLEPR